MLEMYDAILLFPSIPSPYRTVLSLRTLNRRDPLLVAPWYLSPAPQGNPLFYPGGTVAATSFPRFPATVFILLAFSFFFLQTDLVELLLTNLIPPVKPSSPGHSFPVRENTIR